MVRKGVVGLLAIAMTLVPVSVSAGAEEACSGIEHGFLHLDIDAAQPTYRVGDVAKVNAYVTRRLPTGEVPVEDASVVIALEVRGYVDAARAVTDVDGHAIVRIRIERLKAGLADAGGAAKYTIAEPHPCISVDHVDGVHREDFLRIVK